MNPVANHRDQLIIDDVGTRIAGQAKKCALTRAINIRIQQANLMTSLHECDR